MAEVQRFFRYANIIPFPLSMPLLVLRTTFPPQRGNQVASPFLFSVSSPPLGGDAVGRGGSSSGIISLLDAMLTVSGFPIPNPQSLATGSPGYRLLATGYFSANGQLPTANHKLIIPFAPNK